MRGIILKDSVELFGFMDGFKFWFRWSFTDPVQTFWWLNVSHKPYCLKSGWYCKGEKCDGKHLTTRKQVLKHWEKTTKKMNQIEKGKKGLCIYCDKNKGSINIPNPNSEEINQWRVCLICKEIIETQQSLSISSYIHDNEGVRKAHEKLNRIEEEIEEPIVSIEIRRKDA